MLAFVYSQCFLVHVWSLPHSRERPGNLQRAALPLQAYLTDFLCQFAQQPCYVMFSGHLNDNERRVLQTIGI